MRLRKDSWSIPSSPPWEGGAGGFVRASFAETKSASSASALGSWSQKNTLRPDVKRRSVTLPVGQGIDENFASPGNTIRSSGAGEAGVEEEEEEEERGLHTTWRMLDSSTVSSTLPFPGRGVIVLFSYVHRPARNVTTAPVSSWSGWGGWVSGWVEESGRECV